MLCNCEQCRQAAAYANPGLRCPAAQVMAHRGAPRLYRPGLGFIGPALSLVSFARSLGQGPEEGCPEVRNDHGNTRSAPWTGVVPSPVEMSSWYDAAWENLKRAEDWPTIMEVPGALAKMNELRQLYNSMPNRLAAMADAKANALKATKIAQASLCLIHESNEIKKRKDQPKPEPPRPSEDDPGSWWDRFKDWFGFPDFEGGDWKFPELPDIPELPKWEFPKVEPWMIAVAIGALYVIAKKSPQGRAISRLRK